MGGDGRARSAKASASAAPGCSISRTTRPRSPAGPAGGTSPAPRASSLTCSRRRRRPNAAARPASPGRAASSPPPTAPPIPSAPPRSSPAVRCASGPACISPAPPAASSSRPAGSPASSPRPGRHPHPHRGARRRGLGLLLLPPARHPLPPGRGALLDPRGRPGRRRTRRAPHLPGLADPARERRLHPRGLRHRAGRSDAAADPLRPPVPADVRPALPRARPGRAPGLARGPRDPRPLARSTGRRRWSAPASSTPAPMPG